MSDEFFINKDEHSIFSQVEELRQVVKEGNVVLIVADALIPPSGLGVLRGIGFHYVVIDPLPNEDPKLQEEQNLMPVLYRTIIPFETIKLILKLRDKPIEPQEDYVRDEETTT